jgi:hypothetical protein
VLIKRNQIKQKLRLKLPFGYYLERYADLLILRRPDSSFVTAFSTTAVSIKFDPYAIIEG